MRYYNTITQQISERPKSKKVSSLWINPAQLDAEGWKELIITPNPVPAFNEKITGFTYVEGVSSVTQEAVIEQRTFEETQQHLLDLAKGFVEEKMQELHGGIAEQVGKRSGDFGTAAKNQYLADQTTYLKGFQTFKTEVLGATNMTELQGVYDSYPQLRRDN